MTSDTFDRKLQESLALHGEDRVLEAIAKLDERAAGPEANTLTIVANRGVHHLPRALVRGEVCFASEGSLDFSTSESVERELRGVLERLAAKLKERAWKKIYLVPFGPTNLSMLIKLLVYRVTHIETVDLFHAGAGTYFELDIQLRPLVTASKAND